MFCNNKVTDPVCGMEIKVNDSSIRSRFQEGEYYFCSTDCLTKFNSDPQKYVDSSKEDCCGGGHSGEYGNPHGEHKHHGQCSKRRKSKTEVLR